MTVPELAGFVRSGVTFYNAGRYWDAHEALETVWRAERGPARPLWQGLIQAAAAMLHRERGNAHGLAAQGEAALAKLRGAAPLGFPVETSRFAAVLEACVRGGGPVPPMELAAPPERYFALAGEPDDGL